MLLLLLLKGEQADGGNVLRSRERLPCHASSKFNSTVRDWRGFSQPYKPENEISHRNKLI